MSQNNQLRRCTLLGGAIFLLGWLGLVSAQDISTYYTVMHPSEFAIDWKAAYLKGEELTAAARNELPNELSLPYGSDPKQRLDVYLPKDKPTAAPVLIFLHGGGDREGDRAQYGYVARPFAKHGIITVVASYRLQPAFAWPAQRDDAQAVVAWVYRNIRSHGGDPNRIYLSGHSAGSQLTAILSYRDGWRHTMSLPNDVIKGAVLISSLAAGPNAGVTDPALRAELDVLNNIKSPPLRNVMAVGSSELEGPKGVDGRKKADQLVANVRAEGSDVQFLMPKDMDHAEIVLSLNDEDSELTKAVLAMIASPVAKKQ